MVDFNSQFGRVERNIIYVHNAAGEDLPPGTPVYLTPYDSDRGIAHVGKADSADPNKMPAIGVTSKTLKTNRDGEVIVGGYAQISIEGIAGVTVGASLYVAAGGGLSTTPGTDPQVISSVLDIKEGVVKSFLVAFGGAGAGGGGGGATITDPLPFELGSLSFGRLTGTGTFTPPAGGIGVVDFIENVLAEQVLGINASPGSFQYNATSLTATITPTFSASWTTATVTRTLNGTPTVIEAAAASGTSISDSLTLSNFTNYTLNYTLNVTDDFGTSDSAADSINQIPYADPSTSITITRAGSISRSSQETGLFREIGHDASNVDYTFTRNSPLVEMTEARIELNGSVIDTQTITGNPLSFNSTLSNNDPSSPTTSFTYQAKVDDSKDAPASTTSVQTVTYGFPTMFIASTVDGSNGATDLQAVYDTTITAASGLFRLKSGSFAEDFTASSNMVQASGTNSYGWVLYDSSLGSAVIRQGGSTAAPVDWSSAVAGGIDPITATITNDFGESISVIAYRSPFTYPADAAGDIFHITAG